ncbi:Hsp70 family protein [Accumulibacter sp.]|uniref:Hsp70 family protein n=1 Tax=Accumulibacter sp. TaxID=2053492 RepID=UPI0025D8BD40|nr:Hsp70 family protein [Accumulibacter sp.]MCM8595662.1 Hsp70 family protein [Accumulibacter sp.]MCM8625994.1 Hsp70 family protein [Accumulibacter sp.]MDS4049809.1 Hsp70 family protein [Accumulibacter sp.]
MNPILGIDLGTYNSAAAILSPTGEIRAVNDAPAVGQALDPLERVKPFPSYVAFDEDGEVCAVGTEAKALAARTPGRVVCGVKRLLGKSYREALEEGELERFIVPIEPDGETGRCVFEIGGRQIRPEEVCAAILRHIRSVVEDQTGVSMTDVVLSVPAFFDSIQVGATVEAAKLAGFRQIQTVPEPVAAALAADVALTPRPARLLCVDIGAGTLDVSAAEIARVAPGPSGLHCVGRKNTGDNHLGGLDFDDRLVEHVLAVLGRRPADDTETFALRRAVECAKVRLSTEAAAAIDVVIAGQAQHYLLNLGEVEMALRGAPDLLRALAHQVRTCIEGAGWQADEIDHLFLVGGPSVMPCIVATLRGIFYRNARIIEQLDGGARLDPMLAVAVGAAKYRLSQTTNRHPYGYGYVGVRLHSDSERAGRSLRREARILVAPDSVMGDCGRLEPCEQDFTYRGGVLRVELIQQVPESERQVSAAYGSSRYRYLGTIEMAVNTDFPMAVIGMRLNENGELETTLKNFNGGECVTYVGIGGMQRFPIELPTQHGYDVRQPHGTLLFVAANADAVRQWSQTFARTMRACQLGSGCRDGYLGDALKRLEDCLEGWSAASPKAGVNACYNAAKTLLARAFELRLFAEAERGRLLAELDDARDGCFRLQSLAEVD